MWQFLRLYWIPYQVTFFYQTSVFVLFRIFYTLFFWWVFSKLVFSILFFNLLSLWFIYFLSPLMKQFIICLYWERENEREYALNLKIDHQWEILAQYIYCDLMMDLNHIKISANSFNQVNIKKKKAGDGIFWWYLTFEWSQLWQNIQV